MTGFELRIRQFAASLFPRADETCDQLADDALDPPLLALFVSMMPADRRHACQVARSLAESGWGGSDAISAALLHDVGKSCGASPVSLADRIAVVVARRFGGGMPERLTRLGGGFEAAMHHPAVGARCVREAGGTPYLVWLIAHHDRRDIRDDPLLAALIAADDAPPR